MKKIFYFFLTFLFTTEPNFADPNVVGELIIKYLPGTTTGTFSISVTSSDYSWHWENNTVTFDNNFFSHSVAYRTGYGFDSPKSVNVGDYPIPWGLFTFIISTNTGLSRTFQLDLRDEKWSTVQPYGDTFILIDDDNNVFYISQGNGISGVPHQTIIQNSSIAIWSFWEAQSVAKNNFKIPVTLKNRIEDGPSTDFGFLWANNHQVSSGNPDDFRFFAESNSVQHYTLETNYNNERKYSFKWTSANVSAVGNQNYFSPNFGFTIPTNPFTKEITRNFRTVYPLTIKNSAIEFTSTESFGEISFKDPTTDNQFHNYPATSDGFVKNEAFKELNENIPGYGFSKYSVKAVTPVSYNGRNYYWYSGDFNPYNPTDLLITEPTTKTAYFKGTQFSTQTNAYENNSQRKFIKSDDGDLHSVYESIGKVWYERSTDGGQTWEIIGGQPVDSYDSKQPSIDYLPYSTGSVQCVVIAYQRKINNNLSQVCFRIYDDGEFVTNGLYLLEEFNWEGSYGEVDATPVVSISKDKQILFVWKSALPLPGNPIGVQKLIFSFGKLVRDYYVTSYHYEPWPLQQLKEIPTTSINSKNPTIAMHKGTDMMPYHLAYQESNTSIKYWSCTYNLNTGQLNYGNPTTCSSNTGFTEHSYPSIISMGTTARVCWVGYRMVYYEEEEEIDAFPQYRVLFRRPGQTTFWQFGNNVSLPNINKRNDNTYYALAWSENNSQIWFADNTLSTVRLISDVSGQQMQISNGTDKNNMYCMAYEHSLGAPFYFERSNNLGSYYTSQKITNNFFSSGREGVVSVDSTEFYFALGDIEVDGQTINFIEIPDTLDVNNLNSINQCLITEPITLSDNSSFLYSVQYGLNDSLSAVQAITGERFIHFRVLLVDDATGQTIGEYDNVTYTQNNLYQYNNISYQVNTQGIGNRTARLKLVLDNNFESEYSLSRIFANVSVLGKTTVKQISYTGGEVIKSYELSQNYPNPFNPATTIKYQIPKAGNVTLKVYDILGSEVTTLVDEFKEVGKFEVNFDAGSLASGVYIYRLTVNDFVNVKKMVLLK